MNRHQRIVKEAEDATILVIRDCLRRPTEVETYWEVIGCANGVDGHCDDNGFKPWTAFYVLHNDGCRVWGYEPRLNFVPQEGERFELKIWKRHGVSARRKTTQIFAAIYADGETRREARALLSDKLRQMLA